MKVSIIGLGYIGLPTGALIASKGINVLGIDINKDIVDKVNQAELHFYEPDLDKLIKKVVDAGTLSASTSPTKSDVFVITVPTPITDDKKSDISYVVSAMESIAPVLEKGNFVWSKEQLDVAKAKGIIINTPCPTNKKRKSGSVQDQSV